MKPFTSGFRIPSLRDVCQKNDAQRSSDAEAAVQTLTVPYAVGKATLQLTGIHVRLQPLKPQRSANTTANAKGGKKGDASAPSSSGNHNGGSGAGAAAAAGPVVGAIAADIVVHAHVRGELSDGTRSFVIAVVPVRYDASHNADGSAPMADTHTASSSLFSSDKRAAGAAKGGAAAKAAEAAAPAPYDKRVLNAQAREARRGVVAATFPSAFAKVDLRTQMEKVRLSFTVVPVGKMSTGPAYHGKRGRAEDASESADGAATAAAAAAEANSAKGQLEPTLVDCLVDVTVVGTISAIA